MTVTIETMVARWSDPAMRPLFKGRLIDDEGCCCAQGDVLRLCGWSDEQLRSAEQRAVDLTVARELGISVAHSILLRHINDNAEGCPQDVLEHPEKILGDQAARVLAFWRKLDVFDWTAVDWSAFYHDDWYAAMDAAMDAAGDATRAAARAAARAAVGAAVGAAFWAAAWASNEIQGVAGLEKFFFLPLFGIDDLASLDANP